MALEDDGPRLHALLQVRLDVDEYTCVPRQPAVDGVDWRTVTTRTTFAVAGAKNSIDSQRSI